MSSVLRTRTAIVMCDKCISILSITVRYDPSSSFLYSTSLSCGCVKFHKSKRLWEGLLRFRTVPMARALLAHPTVVRSSCDRALQTTLLRCLDSIFH